MTVLIEVLQLRLGFVDNWRELLGLEGGMFAKREGPITGPAL